MSQLTTTQLRMVAALTGRTPVQVQADLDAYAGIAGAAPPPWFVAGSFGLGPAGGAVRVYLDRQTALARDEAPAVILEPAGTSGIERMDGEVGTTGALRLRLRLALGVMVRGDPVAVLADRVWSIAHALLMAERTLGNTLTQLMLLDIQFQRDDADLTAGMLAAIYEAPLVIDEATLDSVLS